MDKKRMMELLNCLVGHIAAANDTQGQIEELLLIGFTQEELIKFFGYSECDFEMRNSRVLIVPANVCIKRFYRVYAHVEENTTDEEIRKAIIEAIVKNQDAELTEDPDMEIEEGDVEYIDIDHEGEWTEEEGEEIREILKQGD